MYLDDGVSRDSAPRSSFRHSDHAVLEGEPALVVDIEARGRYRKVCIKQVGFLPASDLSRISNGVTGNKRTKRQEDPQNQH